MIDYGQTVEVKWSASSKSKYIELGYQFTKLGEPFHVKIEHLPLFSTVKIKYSCDYCYKDFADKPYVDLIKQRRTLSKDVCKTYECKLKKRKELFSHIFIHKYTESLAYVFPRLLSEWNTEKNGGIEPYEIHAGSAKIVWWKCSQGHEWKDRVGNRTRNSTVCKKCEIEKSNLKNTYPDIANEWHPFKNKELTPDLITPMNGRKVWWVCKEGHEWEAKVLNRTKNGSGCPRCNISKGEKKIEEFLNRSNIAYKREYTFEDCKNKFPLRFDFALFKSGKLEMLIEYDGEQHYLGRARSDPSKSKETLRRIQKNDGIKNEYCLKNMIPLLRIPYWEFENIDEILLREIK